MLLINRHSCSLVAVIGLTTVLGQVFVYAQPAPASKPSAQAAVPAVAKLPSPTYPAAKARLADGGRMPLSFEANRGQSDGRVKFLSRGNGYNLLLTDSEAILALQGSAAKSQQSGEKHPSPSIIGDQKRAAGAREETTGEGQFARGISLRMKLVGAHSHASMTGLDGFARKNQLLYPDVPFLGNPAFERGLT